MNVEIRDRNAAKVTGVCVLLAIMVAIVFGQTLHYDFVHYDDYTYVGHNPHVTGGLTLDDVRWAFTHKELGLWNPLVTISHCLDWQLYGPDAGGHHLTNVLLHLASVILLFLILRRMTGSIWRSAFVAALFAIHPLHVESVAWIAERKDVLSGFFFMLTLGAYVLYAEQPRSVARYLSVVLLFCMGLMSKPMLVTVPIVLLLLDYWPLGRLFHVSPAGADRARGYSVNWRVVVEKCPMLALAIVSGVVTMMGGSDVTDIDMEPIPFWIRIREVPANLLIYLGQMIWPVRLSVIYTHFQTGLHWWPGALALLALGSAGIYLLRGRVPYLWMGWLWNLVMLAPVSGIVQISRHVRADHYNYLPQIGLYFGLTWLVSDLIAEWRHTRLILGSAAGVILCALMITARNQTTYWRDDTALWTHALESTTDNAAAHNQLGRTLLEQGRTGEAIAHFREALQIDPSLVEVRCNLGNALLKQGAVQEGIAQLRNAVKIDPTYADAYDCLGVALFRQGEKEEGITQLRKALSIAPRDPEAHFNLGFALLRTGQTEEAITEFRTTLRITPANEKAHYILGKTLIQQGQTDEGVDELREALKLNPADAQARDQLKLFK
jgi:cytochrome c-type biogenesis protein CcmH/NrfG